MEINSPSRRTRTHCNISSPSASRRRCMPGDTICIGIGGKSYNNALNTRTLAQAATSRTPLERRTTTDFPGPATKQRLPTPSNRPLPPRPVPLGPAAAGSSIQSIAARWPASSTVATPRKQACPRVSTCRCRLEPTPSGGSGVGWSGVEWEWLLAGSLRRTSMCCLALRRGKGLAPPPTGFANCQDLFLTFEFSLIFNQGKGGWRVWTIMEEG